MHLPDFFEPVETLVGVDEPSNTNPSIDHGSDELPFNALGGRRFEILGYLLELENADEDDVVTLIQASGDKGRDLLIHHSGVLARIVQCKNLLKKVNRTDVLVELVKLLLFNEVESFLPEAALVYELWAPGGLSERADTLIAEWPNKVEVNEVLAAFQKVTATYKTLEHFRWDERGSAVLEKLKTHFKLKRENGITLTHRLRQRTPVYQRFFQGVVVMTVPDVDLYLDKKLAPKLAEFVRLQNETGTGASGDAIDAEIEDAAAYVSRGDPQTTVSLLRRLEEKRRSSFTIKQLYRVEANLGSALFRLGKAREAAEHFLRAAPLEPEDERASVNEVFAYFLLGNDERAHQLAQSKLQRFPESGRLLAIWISASPPELALTAIQAAIPEKLGSDPEVNVALCRRLMQAGKAESALIHARLAQESAPDWAQSHLMFAHSAVALSLFPVGTETEDAAKRAQLRDAGILAAARAQELALAAGDEFTESQAYAARCELYLLASNQKAAVEDAKRAFLLNPKDVGNILILAQTQLVQGKLEAGIATLEQSLEIEPRPDVRMMLSRALRARGQKDDLSRSVELIEDLVLANLPLGMRAPVAITLVQGLSLLNDWERASAYLEQVRAVLDESTWLALSAFVLKETGHLQDAEGRASESVQTLTGATHPATREFLARVLMSQGRFADALPLYERLFLSGAPAFDPLQLIECAGRLRRDELVLDIFDDLHRSGVVDWRLLEVELHYLHQYHARKAIDRLNAFLDRNPGDKLALLHRSAIAWEIGLNEFVVSRLEHLPTVEEVPLSYVRAALKVLSLGSDRDEVVQYAYRFLKLHFDEAEAHSAMIFSVIGLPHDVEKDPNLPTVVEDAAVGYRELPEGPIRWTVLVKTDSPDAHFEERSIEDALSRELLGKKVGDTFVLAPGLQDRRGEIVQIISKEVRRFQDSLCEMPVRFPSESSNFQSVSIGNPGEIDLGMATVFESVRRRAEQVRAIQEVYRDQPIPVHLYAERFGSNAYEAMLHLAAIDTLQIKCCSGDPMVLEVAVQAIGDAKTMVMDLSCVATFRLLGLEDFLTPETFVLSHDSLVELRETLVNDFPDQQGGTMVYQDGRYVMYQEDKDQKRRRVDNDREFFEKVRAGTTMQPSLAVASVDAEQRETLFKFFGKYGFETVMLATEPASVLLTDDIIQGDLAIANYGIRRSWTHAFLIHLRRQGKISQDRFIDAVAKLIGMRYSVTTINSAEVLACARHAKYDPAAWPFPQVADAFSVQQNSIEQLLRISLGFFLLMLQMPIVPQSAGRLLGVLLERMWSNPAWRPRLLAVRQMSQRIFGLNFPAERAFNEAFDTWQRERDSSLVD